MGDRKTLKLEKKLFFKWEPQKVQVELQLRLSKCFACHIINILHSSSFFAVWQYSIQWISDLIPRWPSNSDSRGHVDPKILPSRSDPYFHLKCPHANDIANMRQRVCLWSPNLSFSTSVSFANFLKDFNVFSVSPMHRRFKKALTTSFVLQGCAKNA